jgi:hypothetical protein
MKRRIFFGMMLLFASLCIISCEDKDDEKSISAAEAVEGTYSGVAPAEIVGLGFKDASLSVKLTKLTDSTVSVSVVNELPVIGQIAAFPASVKKSETEGYYTVDGAGSFNFTVSEVETGIPMPILVEGNVFAVLDVRTLTLKITVGQEGYQPFPISFIFIGVSNE